MDQCGGGSKVIVQDRRGEERTESEGKALDLPVDLCSEVMIMVMNRKNKIKDTSRRI